MRVLVTGDRYWTDRAFIYRQLDEINAEGSVTVVIEGCDGHDPPPKPDRVAPGADTVAFEWAQARSIPPIHFPARWAKFGRRAGPERNGRMLRESHPDLVVAFHPDLAQSKGTADMVRRARRAGVPVIHFTGREA